MRMYQAADYSQKCEIGRFCAFLRDIRGPAASKPIRIPYLYTLVDLERTMSYEYRNKGEHYASPGNLLRP